MASGVLSGSHIVVLGVAGAVLILLAMMSGAVYVAMRPRMALKKRMDMIGAIGGPINKALADKGDQRRQKRIQDKLKQLEETGKKKKNGGALRIRLMQAGVTMSVQQWVFVCIGMGVGGLLLPIILGMPVYLAPMGALIGSLGLPKFILGFKAKRRQKAFTSQFADAIDVVVRGIRSGLPVGECLSIIGREFADPVGEEFRQLVEGQKLGLPLEDMMRRALERIPTAEYKFFAIVLQIQKQTGGNLAETLANLSNVLRERKKMKDKVQALASEAKSSAAIIASLPFFVMGMLSVVNPEYLSLLFTDTMGNVMLAGGAMTMATGVGVMAKMINFDV